MISLYDLLRAANGQLFGEPAAQLFTDFCLDPRQAGESLLYVALRGDRGDTHHYIEEAIRNGASGVLCNEPPNCDTTGVSVLMVQDTVEALMLWVRHMLQRSGTRVVVTAGSTGKSAAVEAIAHVLGRRFNVYRNHAEGVGRLHLALSLARLNPEHQIAVLRLDSTYPGEMAEMVRILTPDVACINRIDCYHPDTFDNCQQLLDDQATVLEALDPNSTLAVLNYDDDRAMELADRTSSTVRTIGIDRFGADLMAFNVVYGVTRTGFDVRHGDQRYLGRWSPLLGKDQLYGVLAALLIGDYYGVSVEEGLRSLTQLEPLPGRLRPLIGLQNSVLVDDTYRASLRGTLTALDWLASVKAEGRRTIFVLGDMDHMGAQSEEAHTLAGERAASAADVLITQGGEAAVTARAALEHGMEPETVFTTYSTDDTIAAVRGLEIEQEDIIVVKGGVAAQMERVVWALLANQTDVDKLVRQQTAITGVESTSRSLRPSWVEIDPSILAANVRTLKAMIGDDVTLMAVVKANGYGHGAVMAARTALLNGASYLAVASMAEAMELRDAGISAPILVLSYLPVQAVRQAIQQNITATVYDLECAQQYDHAARGTGKKLRVHVNIDTGIGRLGVLANDALHMFRHFSVLEHLELEGIYTHFSAADEDVEFTERQVDAFRKVMRPLRAAGIDYRYVHAANSAGLLRSEDYWFNMVRPGLIMYGLQPAPDLPLPEGIRPLLTWKTTVLQVKTFPPGHPVGYGQTYVTRDYERIAILPVGYADGLRRSPQTWREVLVHGQRAPLVGRVSMEKCAINVSHIPEVSAGDEVVLLGRQGDDEITAEEIAAWLGTINYEVVTTLLPRVSRP